MKTGLKFILIIIATGLASVYFGWRMAVLIPMIAAFLLPNRKGINEFLFSFTAIFLLWASYSYFLSNQNHHILANRMSSLFSMSNHSFIFLFTGLIGGLIAGAGGITGYFLHHFFNNKERS